MEIQLSSEMDTPLTVTTVVTGPDGYVTNTSQLVMGGTTTYSSAFMISLQGQNLTGNYMCAATLCSTLIINAYIICSSSTIGSVQFVTKGEIHHTNL